MKYFWIVSVLFLFEAAEAQTITIGNVKVSVKADSAASAQEQALDQAHQLAFARLVSENFPEKVGSLPSQEVLRDMVSEYSIDRENTTPTSYTASLTFQFDEPQVIAWAQQTPFGQQTGPSLSSLHKPYQEREPLKITASYATHSEWLYLKKILEKCVGAHNLSIFTLSSKNANLEVVYGGHMDQLAQDLRQKNILLSQQEDSWVLSLNGQMLP